MNLNWTSAVEIAGFIITLGTLLWTTARNNGKREAVEDRVGIRIDDVEKGYKEKLTEAEKRLQEAIKANTDSMRDMWRWKESHLADSDKVRHELENKITELRVNSASSTAQYEEVLRRLANIELLLQNKNLKEKT